MNSSEIRTFVERAALKALKGSMSEPEAMRVATQTALGFYTAIRTAKNPNDLLACTQESMLSAVATSVAIRLVAGGPNAAAYLVPQRPRKDAQPELQFRVNHRGWAIIGLRAGFLIDPVPVSTTDKLTVRGNTVILEQDPDETPTEWDDLRGVAVYVTHIESGITLTTWVPKKIIAKRRNLSRDGSTWNSWPVDMAMAAAVRYCVARGKLPIDTVDAGMAMAAEVDEVVDTTAEPTPRQVANGHGVQARSRIQEPAALPDYGEQYDELEGVDPRTDPREAVRVEATASEPAPQEQADDKAERADLKRKIADAARYVQEADRVRLFSEYGVPEQGGVGSWKAGTGRMGALLSALEHAGGAGEPPEDNTQDPR